MPGSQTPGVASSGKTVLLWELAVIVNHLRSQFENVLNNDSFLKKINKPSPWVFPLCLLRWLYKASHPQPWPQVPA